MDQLETLQDLVSLLEANPDYAFVREDGSYAYVFDSKRQEILTLEGNFTGSEEVISEALRRAYEEQYPS